MNSGVKFLGNLIVVPAIIFSSSVVMISASGCGEEEKVKTVDPNTPMAPMGAAAAPAPGGGDPGKSAGQKEKIE